MSENMQIILKIKENSNNSDYSFDEICTKNGLKNLIEELIDIFQDNVNENKLRFTEACCCL
jgi:hypothetical protein